MGSLRSVSDNAMANCVKTSLKVLKLFIKSFLFKNEPMQPFVSL